MHLHSRWLCVRVSAPVRRCLAVSILPWLYSAAVIVSVCQQAGSEGREGISACPGWGGFQDYFPQSDKTSNYPTIFPPQRLEKGISMTCYPILQEHKQSRPKHIHVLKTSASPQSWSTTGPFLLLP